ncbi:MAG: hypothetical protein QM534_09860 [Sediminibacterium sp.]|nr:hypothetical protein [Sediminibacterium sp.]
MKKNLLTILTLAIFCLTLWRCETKTEKKSEPIDNSVATKKTIRKKFFEYDAIDYYSSHFDELQIGSLYDNEFKTKIDSFKTGVILGDIPHDISDLFFIDVLEKIGYIKTTIDASKFKSIDSIFTEKPATEYLATACIYVYRDILIFKKNKKIIGTAKVCFSCMANQISGTNANTDNFGQDGDYEKLENLLRH